MQLSEYNKRLKSITEHYDKKKFALAREYALHHGVAKVGDVVEDHYCTTKVEKILISMSVPPSCVYVGHELTKAGKPRKDGSIHHCYQSNMGR